MSSERDSKGIRSFEQAHSSADPAPKQTHEADPALPRSLGRPSSAQLLGRPSSSGRPAAKQIWVSHARQGGSRKRPASPRRVADRQSCRSGTVQPLRADTGTPFGLKCHANGSRVCSESGPSYMRCWSLDLLLLGHSRSKFCK